MTELAAKILERLHLDPGGLVLLAWGIAEIRRMLRRQDHFARDLKSVREEVAENAKASNTRDATLERLLVGVNRRTEGVELRLEQWSKLRRVEPFQTPVDRPKSGTE